MKKCNKVRRLFGPYLYNSVTPAERAAVEEHVDKCEKCAHDLQSRRRVLEKIELHPQFGEMPQKTQDDFAWNVYRRIALGALRRRSRRIFLRRFVLQPSLATLVLVFGIAMGILRFHPRPAAIREPSPVAVRTDETDRKGLREALYVEEFFRRQGVSHEREPSYAGVDAHYSRLSTTKQPSSDADPMMRNVLLLDSRRRLEDANFINYSLGDRRRALAEYQRLVDYYPDTDAAMEARVEIRAILDTEYSTQVENADADQTTDMGI